MDYNEAFAMREIGGYLELDHYKLPMLHEEGIALNSGRNALAYLIKARKIKKIKLPFFICASVVDVCSREGTFFDFYHIGEDFRPDKNIRLNRDEWLYIVNYYGQLDEEIIRGYVEEYQNVIIDYAHSYFERPLDGVDSIYCSRKYFGIPDGAILYTDCDLNESIPLDESYERMRYLLGRFERSASEFYKDYSDNNKLFIDEPIKRMSLLTKNLLHAIDYTLVKNKRLNNFKYLHNQLKEINRLELSCGTFMYPLWIEKGAEIRSYLQTQKIYIPTLWPSVFKYASSEDIEFQMARDILPLPIDQRYEQEDMKYMLDIIFKYLNR